MPSAKSLLSYADVQTILDRAAESPNGISFPIPYGQAIRLRQRAYSLRKILRDKSMEVYGPTDFMYNRTPYDELTFPDPPKVSKDKIIDMRIEKGKTQLEITAL